MWKKSKRLLKVVRTRRRSAAHDRTTHIDTQLQTLQTRTDPPSLKKRSNASSVHCSTQVSWSECGKSE